MVKAKLGNFLEKYFLEKTSKHTTVENLEDYVRELREKLIQRGYNSPIYLVADSNNTLNRYFIICMNSKVESFNGEIK
jgi:dsRNA-specific ribonuclease